MKWIARRLVRRLIWLAVFAFIVGYISTGAGGSILAKVGQVPKAIAEIPDTLGFSELADKIAAIADGNQHPGKTQGATVTRTIDGDTLEVKFGNGTEADVRLLAFDTPEATSTTECGGPEATAFTEKITEGRQVKLITDPSQDKVDMYGRLLRYVRVNGKDVGRKVIAAGWGAPYVFDESNPPRNIDAYRKAARSAERKGKGVWGLCEGNFHSEDDYPWSGD